MGVKIIGVLGLTECMSKIETMAKVDVVPELTKATTMVQTFAKGFVPKDSGFTQEHIKQKPIDRVKLVGEVFVATEYAYWIEFGTKAPHFVPAVDREGHDTGIKAWAIKHGIKGAEKNDWQGMVVSGRPHPFMAMALQATKAMISDGFKTYLSGEFTKICK